MYSSTALAHLKEYKIRHSCQNGLSESTFQRDLARKGPFGCASVHNARFLPFCDVLPPVRVLWVLGATGSYPLEEIFPRAGALGTLGVDGAVAAAISEPLMRGGVSWGRWDSCCCGVQIPRAGMRLAAGFADVSTFLVILVLWLV